MLGGLFYARLFEHTHGNKHLHMLLPCPVTGSTLPDQTHTTTSWSSPSRCRTEHWNNLESNRQENVYITHDCNKISPFDSLSGVIASMMIFAPNHSDIASANDGSTCSAVFQALNIRILVCILSWHSVCDSLTEVLR